MGFLDIFKRKVNFGDNQEQVSKASKGIVKNSYYSYSFRKQPEPSPENYDLILQMYQDDPVVQAAITTRGNAILSSGYTIDGASSAVKAAEKKLDDAGMDFQFMEKLILNGLLYEHVFIEIVDGGKELHILETTQMEIKHDEHGTITGYMQRAENGVEVDFPKDSIVYIKFNSVSSRVWGEIGLKSLYRTSSTKNFVEKFLNSLAQTNAWRQVFKTKSMHDDDIPGFISYLRAGQEDPNMPIVIKQPSNADDKDNTFEILRKPDDLKEFLGLLDYLRTQMLMELKVPPIMIGLPDSSNRSNSDAQMVAFNTANSAFRKKIEIAFNKQLFPAIGLSTVQFSWNPIDKRNEKDDVEMAERLINMGAEPKMVEKFLRRTGLELPEGTLFKKPEPMMMPGMEQPGKKKSMDMYPSRQGKSEGEANQKIGTGQDGTTREDQL